MADRMTAEIAIGGPVPAALVAELIQAIQLENIGLTCDEATIDLEDADDLLRAAQGGPLRLLDHEVPGGEFDLLEAFLVHYGIPFDRWSDGIYEYDPELVRFRPGQDVRVSFTLKNKEPVVEQRQLAPALKALKDGKLGEAIEVLADVLGPDIPDLEPLLIVDTPLIKRKDPNGHLHRCHIEQ